MSYYSKWSILCIYMTNFPKQPRLAKHSKSILTTCKFVRIINRWYTNMYILDSCRNPPIKQAVSCHIIQNGQYYAYVWQTPLNNQDLRNIVNRFLPRANLPSSLINDIHMCGYLVLVAISWLSRPSIFISFKSVNSMHIYDKLPKITKTCKK